MVTPSLRLPTEDDARDIVRRCGFAPESTKAVEAALVALVGEIEAYVALPDAERRARRLRKLSALENAANAWRRCADVFEVARPAEAGELRKVLGPDLGRYLSSAAYGAFLGLPVSPTLSPRDRESRAATSRAGPYPLLEEYAQMQRQELASRHGDRLVAAFAKHCAVRLEAALSVEQLNTGGHPVDWPRRIALVRLLQLTEELSGQPPLAQPSKAFLDFAEICFAAIGLRTRGLDSAAERLFGLLRKDRPDRPRRRRRGPSPPDPSGTAKAPA